MPRVVIKQNLAVKGLCGRCFTYLRPHPLLGPNTLPLHTVYVYTVYLFTQGGGELTR
jgi:hypothetical protein